MIGTPRKYDRDQFARLWNRGMDADEIKRTMGFGHVRTVWYYAKFIRDAGVPLIKRKRGGAKTYSAAARKASMLARVTLPPAVIYDAQGQPIAFMDTMTRERAPFRPGETIAAARARLGVPDLDVPGFAYRRKVEDDGYATLSMSVD